ncbi:hypothetical protein AIDNDMCJ_19307 (plasmid) [Bacillus safensis]|uniref:Uncharacterized protein n=1 Tax=Bacillus pumilus TaxID=1408 RepID=A0A9Q9T4K3_BACPU|nr:hypothetical protein SBRMV_013 [Bacillus pumilus]VCT99208.1 hypothetical protein AIDNDMCJ_19307 [Bacillus safensis]
MQLKNITLFLIKSGLVLKQDTESAARGRKKMAGIVAKCKRIKICVKICLERTCYHG